MGNTKISSQVSRHTNTVLHTQPKYNKRNI